MNQLRKLATPMPERLRGTNGRGMETVDHTVVTQLLLLNAGPYDFDVVEVIRSHTKKDTSGRPVVTGVLAKLTLTIDGEIKSVTEAGGVENADNQDGDGERLKLALSDALKRCAMRFGLGLHMWAQNHYFLDKALDKKEEVGRHQEPPRSTLRVDSNRDDGEEESPAVPEEIRGGATRITRGQADKLIALSKDLYQTEDTDEAMRLLREEHMGADSLRELSFTDASKLIGVLQSELTAS